jgi:hypothetical protein
VRYCLLDDGSSAGGKHTHGIFVAKWLREPPSAISHCQGFYSSRLRRTMLMAEDVYQRTTEKFSHVVLLPRCHHISECRLLCSKNSLGSVYQLQLHTGGWRYLLVVAVPSLVHLTVILHILNFSMDRVSSSWCRPRRLKVDEGLRKLGGGQ